jgi:Cu/Ag efflux pump CusA
VLVAGLTSETRSLMDLRTIADWTVRPRLLAVAGVADVTVFGGDSRSIQVQVHPDQLNFIGTATGNVKESLILGAGLVTLVIFLFLFDLRTAAISCTAIPLSLLAGVIVLERLGITLNTMTLGGLAIAIGVVVDDAIIDVENIVRRLRENAGLAQPRPVMRVVLDACLEVRGAVVYATFAVILVVLPIMALSGIAGRLFAPLGLSYMIAVVASLLVALTVTPALSLLLLAGRGLPKMDPPVVRWTRAAYESLLRAIAQRPRALIGAAAAFTIAGCAAVQFFSGSFIPELREGDFIIHMSAEKHAAVILALVDEQPDATLEEILAALRKRRIRSSRSALWRFFDRHNITFKKKPAGSGTASRGRGSGAPALDPRARAA